jgi:2'-5' RNA ligase
MPGIINLIMDNNSLQINIPFAFHKLFESMAKRINTEDLAGKGLHVGSPHITLRYGINTTNVKEIKDVCHNFFPFFIKFGITSSFPPTVFSEGTVPLIVKIESNQLVALNSYIDKKLPVIPANFDYVPHMTLAYIKPNSVEKYLNMDLISGMEFITKNLVLVHKDNSEVVIKMV